jgi:hypothetical protein
MYAVYAVHFAGVPIAQIVLQFYFQQIFSEMCQAGVICVYKESKLLNP